MCENKTSSTNLVVGVAIGAALGAGLTFLFGTKKGKELRKKIRDDYPEVFDKAEEVITTAKDNLSEDYANVIDQVTKIKEKVSNDKPPRLFRGVKHKKA